MESGDLHHSSAAPYNQHMQQFPTIRLAIPTRVAVPAKVFGRVWLRRRIGLLQISAVLLLCCSRISAVEIPKEFQRMIVSIEVPPSAAEQQASGGVLPPYRAAGTGFLVSPDAKDPLTRLTLITAKHVMEGAYLISSRVYLRYIDSPKDTHGNTIRWELQICEKTLQRDAHGAPVILSDGSPVVTTRKLWTPHPSVDLAAMQLPPTLSDSVPPDMKAFRISDILNDALQREWDIGASDETFILAFHPGIMNGEPSSAVIRHGTIAFFPSGADTFLVDSFVFPGNSGSPVILKPTIVNLKGYQFTVSGNARQAYLLGVVVEFIPYTDLAISPQTQRPRITFEENSGLVRAVRAEKVAELLRAMYPPPTPPAP